MTHPVLAYGAWLAETPADWPEAAWSAAQRAFVDTVGVAMPGAAEPVSRRVFETVARWSEGGSAAIGREAPALTPHSGPALRTRRSPPAPPPPPR